MFRSAAKATMLHRISRQFSTTSMSGYKVCVVGGAGGIGQPLSLLFKLNNLVDEVSLYDKAPHTPGVGVDLSHVNTQCFVEGFTAPENIGKAFSCSNVVMVCSGLPRKEGMSREDLFKTNACIAKEAVDAFAEYCPKALLAIVTNPVNSIVPMAAEILKKAGCYDPRKLFGVTTLDVVRAATFIGELERCDPTKVKIQVIGGHSNTTIVPVLSQSKPELKCDKDAMKKLLKRIQDAGTEVVKAKMGAGSATLSIAYASHQFGTSLLRGLKGEKNIIECCYVESKVTDAPFFATPVLLGPDGMEKNLGLPKLNDIEQEVMKKAVPIVKKNCQSGIDFITKD